MKCKDCGKEGFSSPNAVVQHKRTDCPAHAESSVTVEEGTGSGFTAELVEAQFSDPDAPTEREGILQGEVDNLTAEIAAMSLKVDELTRSLEAARKAKVTHILPMDKCPTELKYIIGRGVILLVKGRITKDGVIVDETERYK